MFTLSRFYMGLFVRPSNCCLIHLHPGVYGRLLIDFVYSYSYSEEHHTIMRPCEGGGRVEHIFYISIGSYLDEHVMGEEFEILSFEKIKYLFQL